MRQTILILGPPVNIGNDHFMAMLQPSMNEASQPAVRHTVLQEIQRSTDAVSSVLTEVQQTSKPSTSEDSDESELRVTNTKKPIRIRKKKVVVSFLL